MKNIFRIVTLVIISLLIIIGTIYIIDINKMKNNKPVLFSTWGYDYAPPETIYHDGNNIYNQNKVSKIELMYMKIIDDIITQDEGLNYGAKYISLDVNSFILPTKNGKYIRISEDNKNTLLRYCKKYNSNIKSYSMEELKENGLYNEEKMQIEGILIYVESIEKISENSAIMTVGKYRSGLGAIFPKYKLTYKNGIWHIKVLSIAIS